MAEFKKSYIHIHIKDDKSNAFRTLGRSKLSFHVKATEGLFRITAPAPFCFITSPVLGVKLTHGAGKSRIGYFESSH